MRRVLAARGAVVIERGVCRGWVRVSIPGPQVPGTGGTHDFWLEWSVKGNRGSFDCGRCAAFAQDDSASVGFVLPPVPKCRGPGAPVFSGGDAV